MHGSALCISESRFQPSDARPGAAAGEASAVSS